MSLDKPKVRLLSKLVDRYCAERGIKDRDPTQLDTREFFDWLTGYIRRNHDHQYWAFPDKEKHQADSGYKDIDYTYWELVFRDPLSACAALLDVRLVDALGRSGPLKHKPTSVGVSVTITYDDNVRATSSMETAIEGEPLTNTTLVARTTALLNALNLFLAEGGSDSLHDEADAMKSRGKRKATLPLSADRCMCLSAGRPKALGWM
jgi:hypothetical protein